MNSKPQIRPAKPDDIPALSEVVEKTDLFPADMLADMIGSTATDPESGLFLTALIDSTPVGLCCAVPEGLADAVWNMLALAVLPDHHSQGLGRQLVTQAEQSLKDNGVRMLIVDTSGTEAFAWTRRFYTQMGYDEEARIRDYWSVGDDKVTFRKLLG